MYYWYVVYFFQDSESDTGFGCCTMETDDNIFNPMEMADQISKQKQLREVVILNWKSLNKNET